MPENIVSKVLVWFDHHPKIKKKNKKYFTIM